jgi:uncharacterized damage-inducible protein DinB
VNEEQFLQAMGGSFSSLRDTLAHMVAVEWLWLERWRHKNPKTLIPAGEFPNLAAVAERWKEVEREMPSGGPWRSINAQTYPSRTAYAAQRTHMTMPAARASSRP